MGLCVNHQPYAKRRLNEEVNIFFSHGCEHPVSSVWEAGFLYFISHVCFPGQVYMLLQMPAEPEEGIRPHGAGVAGPCQLFGAGAGN